MIKMPRIFGLPEPRTSGTQGNLFRYLNNLDTRLRSGWEQIRTTLTSGVATGTLVLDNGSDWRVTLEFQEGRLYGTPTIAASSGTAEVTWT